MFRFGHRKFFTTKINFNRKKKNQKIIDNFFKKYDANGKIKDALKYGEDVIKKYENKKN